MSIGAKMRHDVSCGVVIMAAIVAMAPRAVMAQTTSTEEEIESPQRFAFELRFGSYYPDVDEGLADTRCGAGPYESIFGRRGDLYTEAEFDYQFLDIFVGTLAVGGAIGVFHAQDSALAQGTSVCEASNDETNLWILPVSLLAVLRFDIFAERWSVPLVPYFKVGLTYAFWWSSDEEGISTIEGTNGEERGFGGSLGLRLGGGIMLRLDWIEPRAARSMDNEYGINHSYIFFEYYWAWIDGFGQEGRMNVGDATWALGLALEF